MTCKLKPTLMPEMGLRNDRFFSALWLATAVLCMVLFILFVFNPGLYAQIYGVEADTGGTFLGRRAAPLFLGLAVFLFALRGVEGGPLRDATVLAMVVIFVGIAVTGVISYLIGTASVAILVAPALEVTIAVAFVWVR
jgi:hypothetical protein